MQQWRQNCKIIISKECEKASYIVSHMWHGNVFIVQECILNKVHRSLIPSSQVSAAYYWMQCSKFKSRSVIMTSSNGNIFHITGPLWGEATGHWWIPLTKASDAELWCFFLSTPEQAMSQQWRCQWFDTSLRSLWCRCIAYLKSDNHPYPMLTGELWGVCEYFGSQVSCGVSVSILAKIQHVVGCYSQMLL